MRHRRARDRLRLRRDVEHGVLRHRAIGLAVEPPHRFLVDRLAVAQHERDRAGDTPGVDVLLQEPIDAGESIRRDAVRRADAGGSARRLCSSAERPSMAKALPVEQRRGGRCVAPECGANACDVFIEDAMENRPVRMRSWAARLKHGVPPTCRRRLEALGRVVRIPNSLRSLGMTCGAVARDDSPASGPRPGPRRVLEGDAEASTGTLVLNEVIRTRRCTLEFSVISNCRIVASASAPDRRRLKGASPLFLGTQCVDVRAAAVEVGRRAGVDGE